MNCLWPNCTAQIPASRGFCFNHWKQVPQDLRLQFHTSKGEQRKKIVAEIVTRAGGEAPAAKPTKVTIV